MLTATLIMADDESRELQSSITRFCVSFLDCSGSRPWHRRRAAASCVYAMLTPKSLLRLATPPYLFQPLQILRRLRLEYFWRSRNEALVLLPWGLPIKINPQEAVGHEIAAQGVYEREVTETLWRLADPGDLAIDVGANIGYTTSILGVRVGPKGRVYSFEPHPQVFQSLSENVARWKRDARCGVFIPQQSALGKESGSALLRTDDWFQTNRGTAWISEETGTAANQQVCEVPIQKLDNIFPNSEAIGIVKMDVQGHELSVLLGMSRLLERRAVRDIVFEEEKPFPAPTHQLLKTIGYSIFGLQGSFAGVQPLPDTQPAFDPQWGPVPNYLATRDPARALARLKPLLWRSFGFSRFLGN
jgi:FkbM family methyltransferase